MGIEHFMDPVRSWVNAEEVRRLAGRLMSPTGGDPLPSPETPYGNKFEGFECAGEPLPVQETGPPTPAVEGSPATQGLASVVPSAQPTTAVEPESALGMPAAASLADSAVGGSAAAEVPRGPFLQRVQRFRDWLREQFAVRGMFLLDRDGRVIFDDGVNPRLQALARSLAVATRVAAGAGNVHFKIGSEATLEVIPVETHYGPMVLGAVVPQAISPRNVGLIVDALARAAMPPDGR